ncbi:NRDE family protein [Paraflavitalea speifideaquila]|uniref:NRDE family protein n=1 Tax=Paraflavitalea speifideaquila TaxID=3076558 RepID=UPI0028E5DC0C|nr:NRDE family protein [Paraflavitalea speifideiaquila]
MCTVTYIPVSDKVYLTSNRDEKQGRSPALAPAVYDLSPGRFLFPKDADAGGTWIAAHENGNAIVFLNGGWVAHTPQPPYRKSRGLVLLELLNSTMPYHYFLTLSLDNIEPFTAIIWEDGALYECRWDGKKKYEQALDTSRPYIWSSVTLYNQEVIRKRQQWFESWLRQQGTPLLEDILHFHQFTGDGDEKNDLMMNRDGKVFTVSVTAVVITAHSTDMHYLDLKITRLLRRN